MADLRIRHQCWSATSAADRDASDAVACCRRVWEHLPGPRCRRSLRTQRATLTEPLYTPESGQKPAELKSLTRVLITVRFIARTPCRIANS